MKVRWLAYASLAASFLLSNPAIGYGMASRSALWIDRVNGPYHADDGASALVPNRDGKTVFVVGTVDFGPPTLGDLMTWAYNSSTGATRWQDRYNGPGGRTDVGIAIALSRDGRKIFVVGDSDGGQTTHVDFVTIAYRASTGKRLWIRRYNGPAGGPDVPQSIAVNPNGRAVYVTGTSVGSGNDYATIAYKIGTGATLWVRRYDGPGHRGDEGLCVAVNQSGERVFVTGQVELKDSTYDYGTIAYASRSGRELWFRRYDDPGHASDIGLVVREAGGVVYVTGQSAGSRHANYGTVAYTETGKRLWARIYSSPGVSYDAPHDMAVTSDGDEVIVTGMQSTSSTSASAIGTVVYSRTGNVVWHREYSGLRAAGWGESVAIAGTEVVIAGSSAGKTGMDYTTLAYTTSSGALRWIARYNGPNSGDDQGLAVAIGPHRSKVFVTGTSEHATEDHDVLTLAYRA